MAVRLTGDRVLDSLGKVVQPGGGGNGKVWNSHERSSYYQRIGMFGMSSASRALRPTLGKAIQWNIRCVPD